jgi:hypothetical protein
LRHFVISVDKSDNTIDIYGYGYDLKQMIPYYMIKFDEEDEVKYDCMVLEQYINKLFTNIIDELECDVNYIYSLPKKIGLLGDFREDVVIVLDNLGHDSVLHDNEFVKDVLYLEKYDTIILIPPCDISSFVGSSYLKGFGRETFVYLEDSDKTEDWFCIFDGVINSLEQLKKIFK